MDYLIAPFTRPSSPLSWLVSGYLSFILGEPQSGCKGGCGVEPLMTSDTSVLSRCVTYTAKGPYLRVCVLIQEVCAHFENERYGQE